MSTDQPISKAKERVLQVAEKLFMEHGFNAVKLRDIAQALEIKQASLYYHVPGGKEQLFYEVLAYSMHRHQMGMLRAIEEAGPDWVERLRAAAYWLLSQPPMDLTRMLQTDLQVFEPPHSFTLMQTAYDALIRPIVEIIQSAAAAGYITTDEPELVAGSYLAIIESIHNVRPEWTDHSKETMADIMLDTLANGLRPR